MKTRFVIYILVTLLLVAGCGQADEVATAVPPAIASQSEASETAVPPTTLPPTNTPELKTAVTEPTNQPTVQTTEPAIIPIEVTYFTPSQQEGPYYTVTKPDDRDNDLTVLAGAAGTPIGEVVEFSGKLYDAVGMPVAGAVIEIWQTDSSGVYLHPDDPDTNQRDPNFQFYGEAVTANGGRYSFRTTLPGEYEPRPRHIHVKVKLNGQELITTQFYFSGGPTASTNDVEPPLLINLAAGQDDNGNPIWIGERDIVLNVNLSGE